MKTTSFILVTAALLLVATSARAADLTKLHRTIAHEPAYVSQHPKYCLLVFGPEAKTRVWLVVDGDFLYVDRNGNGDLTEPGKRVRFSPFQDVRGETPYAVKREVQAGDLALGKIKHERLRVLQQRVRKGFVAKERWEEELQVLAKRSEDPLVYGISLSPEIRPRPGDPIPIAGRIQQYADLDGNGYLQFADSARAAPVIHFCGPMSIGLYWPQTLPLGPEPGEFRALVGTPGLGKGTFASVGFYGLIAEEAKPVADIEFPSAVPGGPPLRARYTLPYRC